MASHWIESNIPSHNSIFEDLGAFTYLLPDKETIEKRMEIWRNNNDSRSKHLLKAYTSYINSGLANNGYQLVTSQITNINSFSSGHDIIQDYQVNRLNGVEFVIAPEIYLNNPTNKPQAIFYQYVKNHYRVLKIFDDGRTKIIVFKRGD